jgi:hypothetical protein
VIQNDTPNQRRNELDYIFYGRNIGIRNYYNNNIIIRFDRSDFMKQTKEKEKINCILGGCIIGWVDRNKCKGCKYNNKELT